MRRTLFLLLTAACCALVLPAVAAEAVLESGSWTLTELQGKAFAAPADGRGAPTLAFDAAKKSASGFSGVNRFFGGYERDGEKLKFGQLGSTFMAGPPEQMQVESAFLAMLASVTHWKLAGETLTLLSDGKIVAGFTPRAAGDGRQDN